jgi:signal peptidase I
VVKRVAAVAGDAVPADIGALAPGGVVPEDRLVVLGDNPARSFDSRQSGFLHAGRIVGVVLRRIGQSPRTPPETAADSDNR